MQEGDEYLTMNVSNSKKQRRKHVPCPRLGYKVYIDSLLHMLTDLTAKPPRSLGIYGYGGQGKTFIIDFLRKELKEKFGPREHREASDGMPQWKSNLCCSCCSCSYYAKPYTSFWGTFLLLVVLFLGIIGILLFSLHYWAPESEEYSTASVNGSVIYSTDGEFHTLVLWYPICAAVVIAAGILLWKSVEWYCGKHYLESLMVILFFKCKGHSVFARKDALHLEVIPVYLNARENAGPGHIWAAILAKTTSDLRDHFSSLSVRTFNLVKGRIEAISPYGDCAEGSSETINIESPGGDSRKDRRENLGCCKINIEDVIEVEPRKWCCCPIYVLLLIAVPLGIICVAALALYSRENKTSLSSVMKGLGGLGVSIASIWYAKFLIDFLKSRCSSEEGHARKLENSDSLSKIVKKKDADTERPDVNDANLTVTAKVKNEGRKLSKLVNYMAWINQIVYRVVIFVDDLDRCEKKEALNVLEVMDLLFTYDNSPFVPVFTVNTRDVGNCVQLSAKDFQMKDERGAREYIQKVFHLNFYIPEETVSAEDIKFKANEIPVWVREEEVYYEDAIWLDRNPRNIERIHEALMFTFQCGYRHTNSKLKKEKRFRHILAKWVIVCEQWPYRASLLLHTLEESEKENRRKLKNSVQKYDGEECRAMKLDEASATPECDKRKDRCTLTTRSMQAESFDCDSALFIADLETSEEQRKILTDPEDSELLLSLDYKPHLLVECLSGGLSTLESGEIQKDSVMLQFSNICECLPYTVNLDPSLRHIIQFAKEKEKFKI